MVWTALFSMATVVAYGGERVKGKLLQSMPQMRNKWLLLETSDRHVFYLDFIMGSCQTFRISQFEIRIGVFERLVFLDMFGI